MDQNRNAKENCRQKCLGVLLLWANGAKNVRRKSLEPELGSQLEINKCGVGLHTTVKGGFKTCLIQGGGRRQTQPYNQTWAKCAGLAVDLGHSITDMEQKPPAANITLGLGLGSSEVRSR